VQSLLRAIRRIRIGLNILIDPVKKGLDLNGFCDIIIGTSLQTNVTVFPHGISGLGNEVSFFPEEGGLHTTYLTI